MKHAPKNKKSIVIITLNIYMYMYSYFLKWAGLRAFGHVQSKKGRYKAGTKGRYKAMQIVRSRFALPRVRVRVGVRIEKI